MSTMVIRIWLDNLAADGSGMLDRLLKPLLQRFALTAGSSAAGVGNELANCANPSLRQLLLDSARNRLLPSQLPHDCQLENVVHRLKERGTLLEFTVPKGVPSEQAGKDVLQAIRQHFGHPPVGIMEDGGLLKSLFTAAHRRFRPFLVKGEPFLDDIITRTPSNRLRIDFCGGNADAVPLERMYAELRPFGRLIDLSYSPAAAKDTPRYLLANYLSTAAASSARTCLNGYRPVAGGPRLLISYDKMLRTNTIFKWLADHPRVSVPIGGATLLGISYAVFDPIRIYFIGTVITGRYFSWLPDWLHVPAGIPGDLLRSGTERFRRIWSSSMDRFTITSGGDQPVRPAATLGQGTGKVSEDEGGERMEYIVGDREIEQDEIRAMCQSDIGGRAEVRQRLENWLKEPPSNFMLIAGPRGYGKADLVRSAVSHQRYSLWIHCDEIMGHSNAEIVAGLANQVGYFPLFGFLSSLSNLLDAAISATTGQKASQFVTSEEGQVRKILELTAVALNEIVARQKQSGHYQSMAATASVDGKMKNENNVTAAPPVSSLSNTTEGADARPADKATAIDYPTIIISGFMTAEHLQPSGDHQQQAKTLHHRFHEELIDWAAFLVQNGIARVVFVTSTGQKNGGSSSRINRILSKALPLRPLDMAVFSDARPEEAFRYLQNQIGSKSIADKAIATRVLESLGGRLADLETFVTKVKAGMTAEEALDDLLVKAMIEIRKYGFGEEFAVDSNKSMVWSPPQFWFILKCLAADGEAPYCRILFSPLFKGESKPLQAMERADLISITYVDGQPTLIRPSKFLYLAAFKRILTDANTATTFDFMLNKALWDQEEQKIKEYERELRELKEALDVRPDAWKASAGGWFGGGSTEHPLVTRYRFIASLLEQSQKKAEQYATEKSRLESLSRQ